MKKFLLAVVAIVVLAFAAPIFSQKSDTTFFYFAPYRSGVALQPVEGWARFDSLMADDNFNLIIIGKADLQVKVYKNLQAGVAFEQALQYPTMLGFAHLRADAGRDHAGRGEVRAEVVKKAENRGITLIRVPKPQPKPQPIPLSIRLSAERIALYPGATYELGSVAKVVMSDSGMKDVDGFLNDDTAVDITQSGHLTAGQNPDSTEVTVYTLVNREKVLANNEVTLKKTIRVDILPFPELRIPKPESAWPIDISAGIGYVFSDKISNTVPMITARLFIRDNFYAYGGIGESPRFMHPIGSPAKEKLSRFGLGQKFKLDKKNRMNFSFEAGRLETSEELLVHRPDLGLAPGELETLSGYELSLHAEIFKLITYGMGVVYGDYDKVFVSPRFDSWHYSAYAGVNLITASSYLKTGAKKFLNIF